MTLTIGNSPPSASCNSGQGTYQAGVDVVTLEASAADFDGDVVCWTWSNGATVLASGMQGTAAGGAPVALPQVILSTGVGADLEVDLHTLTLTIDDGANAVASCTVEVNVVDTQSPSLAPVSDCSILWPPNHQMGPVTIQANASDSGGGPVLLGATVTSNEDPKKNGSGNTVPDWTEPQIDQATGTITLSLRAERSGRGTGRVYTVTIMAVDALGNTSTASVTCSAPHDRGQ